MKIATVVEMPQVRDLVGHDITADFRRSEDQAPAKADCAP
jgi:hypothetical protein